MLLIIAHNHSCGAGALSGSDFVSEGARATALDEGNPVFWRRWEVSRLVADFHLGLTLTGIVV